MSAMGVACLNNHTALRVMNFLRVSDEAVQLTSQVVGSEIEDDSGRRIPSWSSIP
jgi:hypothetical protein